MVAHAYHFRQQTGRQNSTPAQAIPQKLKSNRIEQIRKEIHPITSRNVFLNKGGNTSIKEASSVRNTETFPETTGITY